jgi:hypothetical protein
MKKYLLLFITVVIVSSSIKAQDYDDHPGQYMDAIEKAHNDMDKQYMAYTSAAAHRRRARKVEKLRKQVLTSIEKAEDYTMNLPYYKSDNSLRQSSIDYIKMCYSIFNEDYDKIVNMEDIAEQSVDEMEAYILLKEKTDEKLHEAGVKLHAATVAFAAKYNVNLIEGGGDELSDKMAVASKLHHYHNKIFIVFFKCNWEDNALTKAINDKKVNDAEQARTALIKYCNEGLAILDTTKGFEGDLALVNSCKNCLKFYKKMAENDVPKVTDFFVKEENFQKLKKNLDGKSSPSKEEVDTFNKAVNDFNVAVNVYNQNNQTMNNGRNEVIADWDKTGTEFYDTHMPHYKK